MLTNKEIADANIDLMRRCCRYQFNKCANREWEKDFLQDLYLIILDYDNDKLNDACEKGRLNALFTRIIRNNLHSSTSTFYRTYRKPLLRQDDINEIIRREDTDDIE